MSIAGITTLGFGSYATVNQAVVLGFFSGVIPPPPPAVITSVPGPADKRKRDRDEYFRRRHLRKKQERELKAKQPQRREEQVNVIEHQPRVDIDVAPGKKLFSAVAPPILQVAQSKPFPDMPPVPPEPKDDVDMFLLME